VMPAPADIGFCLVIMDIFAVNGGRCYWSFLPLSSPQTLHNIIAMSSKYFVFSQAGVIQHSWNML